MASEQKSRREGFGGSCALRPLVILLAEKPWMPYRYKLVLLLFFGFFNAISTRYCFNIAMVAMVNYTEPTTNASSLDHCPDIPISSNSTSKVFEINIIHASGSKNEAL